MFAIRFIKAAPTSYILQFKNGRVLREGSGLSCFYYAPTTTIVSIPLASADVPFAFQESTVDFQSVSIQGQLTYRVSDPKKLASLLDFSVSANGVYPSEDGRKLPERFVHTLQTLIRNATQKIALHHALIGSPAPNGTLFSRLN